MIDIKLLRQQPDVVAAALKRRGYELDLAVFAELDQSRKTLQVETESLQAERNRHAKSVGAAKAKGEDITPLLTKVADLGDRLKSNEQALEDVQQKLQAFLYQLPNLPQEGVPQGSGEEDNVVLREVGDVPSFDFTPQDHMTLGENLGQVDAETAAKLSGSRFVILRGGLAKLQRALAQFMLDYHSEHHGYTEMYVPYLVHEHCLYGTGQLPKFKEDQFEVAGEGGFSLIPTAEVPLVNSFKDELLRADDLPIKIMANTPCFRSEAGSYGKDTRGMIRQHQFEKVELVQLVAADESNAAHEELTGHAETILQQLGLPYRVVELCTGDLGFTASKTYDLDVWLPSQNTYREISSCSNCQAFQARRIKARWHSAESGQPELLHTLNGSGVAVGRALVAIMENYQDEKGAITVPKVLLPYMNGVTKIEA